MRLIERTEKYHRRLRRDLIGGTQDFLPSEVVPALRAAEALLHALEISDMDAPCDSMPAEFRLVAAQLAEVLR